MKTKRPPRISQAELAEYLRLTDLEKVRQKLRGDLMQRLAAGAKVQAGPLLAEIQTSNPQRLSWDAVAAVLSPTEVQLLRDRVPKSEEKRLSVRELKGEKMAA